MTTLSKSFLSIAIVGLTAGSIVAWYGDNASPVALTAVLPLGAIAFGMFLIVFTLEKEVAVYDQEQAAKEFAPQCDTAAAANKREIGPRPATVQLNEKTYEN